MVQAENIWSHLRTITRQLAGWDHEGAMSPSTESTIDQSCDYVLDYLRDYAWPVARKGRGPEVFEVAADSYRQAAEASLGGIESSVAAQQRELDRLSLAADDTAARADESLRQAATVLEMLKGANENVADNANVALADALSAMNSKEATQRAAQKKMFENVLKAMSNESEQAIRELRQARDTGNELVRMVADQSVGGEYLKFAENEKAASLRWNGIGIAAVILAFGYLVIAYWAPDWGWVKATIADENIWIKIGISLSLAGFSAYAFREAGKRMRQSVDARYRALDVLALPPFLKDLEPATQEQLRVLLGQRLFAGVPDAHRDKSGDSTASLNLAVDPSTVKAVAELLRVIRPTGGS